MVLYKSGKGEPLMFLHGFCETARAWNELINDLNKTHCCLSADLPGYGQSALLQKNTIEEWADDLQRSLSQAGIDKVHLIGHSMGGYLALQMAASFPESVKSISLINSHCFADDETKKQTRQKAIEHLQQYGKETFVKELFQNLFYDINKHNEEIVRFTNEALRMDVQSLVQSYEMMMQRPSHESTLRKWKYPVYMAIGEKDKTIDLELSKKMAALPALAYVQFFENSAHMSFVENKTEIAQGINQVVNLYQALRQDN